MDVLRVVLAVQKPMRVEDLKGRVMVDTNVLIYATLTADPRHIQSQEILALRLRPDIEMFISVQNLAEMYPNLTGPKNKPADSPNRAREKIRSVSRLCGLTALPLTQECIQHALDLCVEGEVNLQNYFDRQLAAMMIREAIPIIITENAKDFTGIKDITALNPFG